MIDFGLPHASSLLFLAAAKTKLFNDAKTTSPAIASFTGYNSIELEHLEGITLGTYGSFMGRDEACYNLFKVLSNISQKKPGIKVRKARLCLKMSWRKKNRQCKRRVFFTEAEFA